MVTLVQCFCDCPLSKYKRFNGSYSLKYTLVGYDLELMQTKRRGNEVDLIEKIEKQLFDVENGGK